MDEFFFFKCFHIPIDNQETYENKILKKNALFNFDFTKTGNFNSICSYFASFHINLFYSDLTDYISKNIRKRIDIGITWIYHNYITYKQLYDNDIIILQKMDHETQSKEYEEFIKETFRSLQRCDPRDL